MSEFNIFKMIEKIKNKNKNDKSHLKNLKDVLEKGMEIQPNQFNINNICAKDGRTIGWNLGNSF